MLTKAQQMEALRERYHHLAMELGFTALDCYLEVAHGQTETPESHLWGDKEILAMLKELAEIRDRLNRMDADAS